MWQRLITYIKEARQELRKVTWLSRAETMRYTVAVILISLAVALFLGGIDLLFSFILTKFVL